MLSINVAVPFESVDETLVCDHSVKAIEQYFHVVHCSLCCTRWF